MKNSGSKVNPVIWLGDDGALQKNCAKDIGDPGKSKGSGPGDRVSQCKIDMRVKAWRKKTVLINKLKRTSYVSSTQPGAWGHRNKWHRVSVLSCDKSRKRIFRKLRGKKNRAEKKMLKKYPSVLEFSKSGISSNLKKVDTLARFIHCLYPF